MLVKCPLIHLGGVIPRISICVRMNVSITATRKLRQLIGKQKSEIRRKRRRRVSRRAPMFPSNAADQSNQQEQGESANRGVQTGAHQPASKMNA